MVPAPLGERTEAFLRQKNWEADGEILTMIGDAAVVTPLDDNFTIEVRDEPSADWLELESDHGLHELFIRTPASYISISQKEKVVARGRIGFDDSWGILTRIFVSESSRGQGLGETIVRAAADIARRRRIYQLALHVDSENVSAISLYSKLGFRKHHVVRFYQNGSLDNEEITVEKVSN